MELEYWAAIAEAPAFEVSTLGRVRKGDDAIGTWENRGGYVCVSLELTDGRSVLRYVHRLILEAFDELPGPTDQANHGNGRKADNRLDNLEWTTAGGNVAHAWRTGLQPRTRRRRGTCRYGHPLTQKYTQRSRGAMRSWFRCARCRRVLARQARDRALGFRSLLELLEVDRPLPHQF